MNKRILKLAIPNIISNVSIPLLGLIDIAILGHLKSEVYLGAVAIGVVLFNFIFMSLGFLRMGTSGTTAQLFGAKKFIQINDNLIRGIGIGSLIGLLLILFQIPIKNYGFGFMSASPEVISMAYSYFDIRIYAAPAVLANYVLSGWFTGMQNTRFTMVHALALNILNIILNVFFVIFLNMNVAGVALGFVIAQFAGLLFGLALYYFNYYPKLKKYGHSKRIFAKDKVLSFFKINGNLFIRTICLLIAFSMFTMKSAAISNTVLAMNTILLQFLYLFSYLVDGFANAAEAIVGRYFGAKDSVNLKKSIKLLFIWGLGISIAFSLVYLFFFNFIMSLLTNNINILSSANDYKYWIVALPFAAFAAFIWDGIFIGLTATKQMRNAMVFSLVLVFIPAYYMLGSLFQSHGIWMAMILFMLARSISMKYLYDFNILKKL
ncbi:MAG: MATE family efflux transporter [Bacteroidota bacterium]